MNTPNENNSKPNKKARWLYIAGGVVAIGAVVLFCYYILSGIQKKEMEAAEAAAQEQFAGDPEISSQLQAECQHSAERLAKMSDFDSLFAEYKTQAEQCLNVYVTIEKSDILRNEGMYPDLAVDIASRVAPTDKSKALEILNFANSLPAWEYYMGPVSCDSQAVIEAYVESLQNNSEQICFKKNDHQALRSDLKNKNFAILNKTLAPNSVVWVGLPDSEVGCPEKMSAIIKLAKDLSSGGDVALEEGINENPESGNISFMFKSKTEDKIIFEFSEANSCLRLSAVLVPTLQTQE